MSRRELEENIRWVAGLPYLQAYRQSCPELKNHLDNIERWKIQDLPLAEIKNILDGPHYPYRIHAPLSAIQGKLKTMKMAPQSYEL